MTIKANLKRLMDNSKIGNKELSEKSGVPLRTINNLLSGVTDNPTITTLQALSKILNCMVDDFVRPDDMLMAAEESTEHREDDQEKK